jgi:hypothetical protein
VPEQLPLSKAESPASTPTPSATVAAPADGLPWVAFLLLTAGAGLAVLVAARLIGTATRPTLAGAGSLTARPGPAARRTGRLTSRPGPSPRLAPSAAVAPPAPAPRDGLRCEIHWESDEDGSWFVAMTSEDDEHEILADSPDFAWGGAGPPSRTPEARAALHELVRRLEAAGWRSIPGHGRQHGELRWYARRFLPPADWRQ